VAEPTPLPNESSSATSFYIYIGGIRTTPNSHGEGGVQTLPDMAEWDGGTILPWFFIIFFQIYKYTQDNLYQIIKS